MGFPLQAIRQQLKLISQVADSWALSESDSQQYDGTLDVKVHEAIGVDERALIPHMWKGRISMGLVAACLSETQRIEGGSGVVCLIYTVYC